MCVLEFIFSLPLWFSFDSTTAAMQFVERYEWIPSYGISYYVGVDVSPNCSSCSPPS